MSKEKFDIVLLEKEYARVLFKVSGKILVDPFALIRELIDYEEGQGSEFVRRKLMQVVVDSEAVNLDTLEPIDFGQVIASTYSVGGEVYAANSYIHKLEVRRAIDILEKAMQKSVKTYKELYGDLS